MGVPIPKSEGPPPKPSEGEGEGPSDGKDLPSQTQAAPPVLQVLYPANVPPAIFPFPVNAAGCPRVEPEMEYNIEEAEKSRIKREFIGKSYITLFIQLLFTFTFISFLCPFRPDLNLGARNNRDLVVVAAGITLALVFIAYCCEKVKENSYLKITCLAMMTIAEVIILATVASRQSIMLNAFVINAAVSIVLTFFAFQTKLNFSIVNLGMVTMFALAICLVMIALSKKFPIFGYFYGFVGVFFHSVGFVRDTQEIGRKYQAGDDIPSYVKKADYVHAALKIFTNMSFMLGYMYCTLYGLEKLKVSPKRQL